MATRLLVTGAAAMALLVSARAPAGAQEGPGGFLAALFNTAGNLGFATVRAALSAVPDQPPETRAREWMVVDYGNARKWGAGLASCVSFDLARLDDAAARAAGGQTSARQLWQLADGINRDYRAALGRATCRSGLSGAGDVDAFFGGALFLGYATARASYYFYADTPTPPDIARQIVDDLGQAATGLQVARRCAPGTAGIEARMQTAQARAGRVPGKDLYTEIAGIYIAFDNEMQRARCPGSATDAPAAPGDSMSCMKAQCAEPCAGAVMLLGVISGSPACQACVAQKCGR